MKIRWTPEAANDLEQIARHLLRDNPKTARTVVRTLTDSIANLKKPMERAFRDWNHTVPKNVTYLTPSLLGAQHH